PVLDENTRGKSAGDVRHARAKPKRTSTGHDRDSDSWSNRLGSFGSTAAGGPEQIVVAARGRGRICFRGASAAQKVRTTHANAIGDRRNRRINGCGARRILRGQRQIRSRG